MAASEAYDFIIVGGGSAGCALANRLSADPANRVLVLEAGRPDYKWDVFIHMPAALTFPIGSRFYDWKYESEPEPYMNGRRIYHARGKVLGGSSSINGMIFQRGNPLDYARWSADPGMASWDYAHCLPYFKRMETCLAGADEFRGGDGPLVLERGPATARCSARSSRPCNRRATSSPTTSTGTGRKASRRSTATCTAAGDSGPPAPTCTRARAAEPDGAHAGVRHQDRLYGYLYGEPEGALRPAVVHRAPAMDLSDQWVREGCEPEAGCSRWSTRHSFAPTPPCSPPSTTTQASWYRRMTDADRPGPRPNDIAAHRAADVSRDAVAERLRIAAREGQLEPWELDDRIGRA